MLEAAYRYALQHGLADLSLRPLASAIGSSPRVLLYLFGSKAGLIRALLARARAGELEFLAALGTGGPTGDGSPEGAAEDGLIEMTGRLWSWLSAPEHRPLLTLWVEGYARSLAEPHGPWADFGRSTVEDWLVLLAAAQPAAERDREQGRSDRTVVLAVLRGALLDLLATGDVRRTTDAVHRQLHLLDAAATGRVRRLRPRRGHGGAGSPRR